MQIHVRRRGPNGGDEIEEEEENHALPERMDDLDEDHIVVVTPGQVISTDTGAFLRGHGTYLSNHQLIASVSGVVEKVNQLISVRPLVSRYIGEVGDIIVGRITEVGNKRWKVDVNGQQDASLMLSAVNLPGGAQRRRTYEDQLQMRTFFIENDLISAEIQEVRYDGTLSLHTRSLKYGKLENGQFIQVSPSLVKRMKQHMISLDNGQLGIDLILGNNGYIWISRSMNALDETHPELILEEGPGTLDTRAEILAKKRQVHAQTPMNSEDRVKIARAYKAITLLNEKFRLISPESILSVYENLLEMEEE